MFLGSQHFEGKGACWSSGTGLGQMTSRSIIHMDLHKLNNKLINAQLEHFWCTYKPRANKYSQNSPWSKLGGSHHLPLILLFMFSHRTCTQMSFCLGTSKFGSPKILKIETPKILQAHNFLCKPLIDMRSNTKF
jgi:hypothetical protein